MAEQKIAKTLSNPRICGFEWTRYNRDSVLHGVVLFGLFFLSMAAHDAVQEQVQKRLAGRRFGLLLSMVECFSCVIGPVLSDGKRALEQGGPLKLYLLLSLVVCTSIALSNLSLLYVAYPVKVVGKSTKLVPAMMLSWCILSRSYSVADYVCALLLCIGLAGFTLAEYEVSGNPVSLVGLVLLAGACTVDAVAPNVQERVRFDVFIFGT